MSYLAPEMSLVFFVKFVDAFESIWILCYEGPFFEDGEFIGEFVAGAEGSYTCKEVLFWDSGEGVAYSGNGQYVE
jgi:hypothetical protein